MDNEKPTVSVILPTYNRAHLIGRSIQSVLDQTYRDFEIIVVDDGSTDNTEEVVKNFLDTRIRYIRNQKNNGGSAARNTGIKLSNNEYIAFQDSDDEWLPDKLEKQMAVFKNASAKVGVVYCGFWKIMNNNKIYISPLPTPNKNMNFYKTILKRNFITTQSAIVKKDILEEVGMFDDKIPAFQDWDLWIRISKYYDFKCIDEALIVVYYQSNSISANQKARIQAHKMILDKYFEDIKKDRTILANYYFNIGAKIYLNGGKIKGMEYLFKSILTHPKYVLFTFAPVFGQYIYNKIVNLYHKR